MTKIKFSVFVILLNVFIISAGKSQLLPSAKLNKSSNIEWNKKIAPLLEIQLDFKMSFEQGLQKAALDKYKNMGLRTENPENHLVYLYFKEYPSPSQIADIENMGGIVYPDSWVPPVGAHPRGFIIAQVPVNNLNRLAEFDYVEKIDTAEELFHPNNDNAMSDINADVAWGAGYEGTGVVVGVLDSGLDTLMADLPSLIDSRDYSAWPSFDDGIENTVTGHGTHVTGSVLGRGTRSSGKYKGAAPAADLVFLKIGSDASGSASSDAMVNAIMDAVDVYDVDIITMSYGGWGDYHDGTRPQDQAVDYAVDNGVTVFISAGNEGNDGVHYSGTVLANDETGFIQVNVSGAGTGNTALAFNLVWYDGLGTSNILDVEYYDNTLTGIASGINSDQSESPTRGTESEISFHTSYLPSGSSTYYVKVVNSSASDQDFHLYYFPNYNGSGAGSVTFQNADPFYTLSSPATADGAIAVGAHVSRSSWTDFEDNGWTYGYTLDDIAPFSSRGPRVDEMKNITLTAPGSTIISLRDSIVTSMSGPYVIDNDGINDGTGPANYIIMQGTSMACPIAAGAVALLLSQDPTLTPAQIKDLLTNNADSDGFTGSVPNDTWGYGKLNIERALEDNLNGTIFAQAVNATGGYTFTGTDLSMNFSTNGTNGDVTVAEINATPPGGTTNVGGSLDHVSGIRYWDINTDKSGFTTSITFTYNPEADGIVNENTLLIARRDYDEDIWTEYADITRNPGSDQITANNVTGFSQWIFADELEDNPLPVTLTEFSCTQVKDKIHISWTTESELENWGFNLYRAEKNVNNLSAKDNYIKINTELIDAAGNSAAKHEYTFSDEDVQFDKTYLYILEDISYEGIMNKQEPIEITVTPTYKYALFQNYPNPFNATATISYSIPHEQQVTLKVYDLMGKEIATLLDKKMDMGNHSVQFDASNLSSGIYLYMLKAGSFTETKKLMLVK